MNRRTTISLILNALLLGFVVWLVCAGSRPETRAGFSRGLRNGGLWVNHELTPPPSACEPLPEVVQVSESFDWAQLESTDYAVYLANLRAISCPELTVRDIIIADVNDLFSGRVKALVDEVSGRFWELIIRPDAFEKMVDDKHTQLRALENERDELFSALFGENNPRSAEDLEGYANGRREQWASTADFLSEPKRALYVAAKADLENAWTDFLRTPGLTGVQQQAKRKELEAASDQALRDGLTAEECNELRLRQSPSASLRDRLVGLDWSEETVRAVAYIQFVNAAAPRALLPQTADLQSRMAHFQQQAEAQILERIGPEAYAALQRVTDSRYEPIYRVAQRLELPDTTAALAYDLRRQANDLANRVQADKSLTAEERLVLLQVIGTETRQSLSAALGAKGVAAYEKIDGGWMQQLTSVER